MLHYQQHQHGILINMNIKMISKVTLAFLQAVKENNNVEWMNQQRDLYHMERDNFFDLVQKLINALQKIDKSIGSIWVKDCTFRFNKDIRFIRDKSPYKTNFGAIIRTEGKHGEGAGYYIHIEPGKSFIGGGVYMPPAATLQRIRKTIAKNYQQVQKIITTLKFKKTFGCLQWETLQNIPRGFNKNHKAGDLLKMKSFSVVHKLSDIQVMQDDFVEYFTNICKILKPLNDFLNK